MSPGYVCRNEAITLYCFSSGLFALFPSVQVESRGICVQHEWTEGIVIGLIDLSEVNRGILNSSFKG